MPLNILFCHLLHLPYPKLNLNLQKKRLKEEAQMKIMISIKSSILCSYLAHFSTWARKNKKIHPKKIPYISGNGTFLILILKNFRKRKTWKKFPYTSGNRNLKKASYISENETFQSTLIKFIILQETKAPKISLYFLKRKLSLYFGKQKPRENSLHFRKGIFKTLVYL